MRKTLTIAFVALLAMVVLARPATSQEILDGTWKLISSTRTNIATGVTIDTFGPKPQGFITYTRDGRMGVLIMRSDRPKPQNIEKITEQERSQLFSSMMAYTGTYKFDGKTIEHQIDLSWNEVWSGTKQIRDVKKEGDRLIYTTRPSPSPVDGSMGIGSLTWEKMK